MRVLRAIALVSISLAVLLAVACSGGDDRECHDDTSCATNIPAEVMAQIPAGSPISANTTADFNGDGKDDYVVAYGPIVNGRNTQLVVITDVGGELRNFTDPVGLQFQIGNYNGDGVDDLAIWSGNPATWHEMTWSSNDWVPANQLPD